jgi:hypothetical protein
MRTKHQDGSETEQKVWQMGNFKVLISRVRNHPLLGTRVVSIDIGSHDSGAHVTHYDVHVKDLEQLEGLIDALTQAEVKWRRWLVEDGNWSIEDDSPVA